MSPGLEQGRIRQGAGLGLSPRRPPRRARSLQIPGAKPGSGDGGGGDGERRPERRGRALALRRDIRFLGSGRRIAQRLSCGILALRSGSWVGVSQLSSRGPSTNQARRWRPGIVARYPGQGPLRSTPPRATPKRLLLGQGRGGSHPGLLGQTPL